MQIIYKTASILDAAESYIIHGCNAQGKMGSGVAKVLFDRYPNVRTLYLAAYERARVDGKRFLGTIHYCPNEPHNVINAITQDGYGYDGRLYADYEAIAECFLALDAIAPQGSMQAVAMPLVGCGLAGGSWPLVSEIIERTSTNYQPVVYVPDGKVPS